METFVFLFHVSQSGVCLDRIEFVVHSREQGFDFIYRGLCDFVLLVVFNRGPPNSRSF